LNITNISGGRAADGIPSTLNIFYIGEPHAKWQDEPVYAALAMDPVFNITRLSASELPANPSWEDYDLIVIQDSPLTSIQQNSLLTWIQAGGAVLIFCGPRTLADPSLFQTLGVVNASTITDIQGGPTNAVPRLIAGKSDTFVTGFDWKAVPDVANYTIFPRTDPRIDAGVIIEKEARTDSTRLVADPLIFTLSLGSGQIAIFSPWVEDGFSIAFRGCPFFNYLVYSAAITRAGLSPNKLSYKDWKYSPVPHPQDQIWVYACIIGAAMICVIIVKRARSKSKQAIDAAKLKELAKPQKSDDESPDAIENVKTEIEPESAQPSPKKKVSAIRHPAWEKIGLHKQISGFFVSLIIAILAAGPQIILILLVFPRFIMPFPQAAGIYTIVNDLFAAVWLMLDVGTSVALVTFFSTHRVERPEKAVHYVQIFIFWQMLSGVCQFTVVAMLSLFYFPGIENYAYLSYHILIHSAIQFPGFLSVMLLTLRALQRSDLEQISNLLVNFVFKLVVAYLCVLFFRWVFKDSVQFGEIFGAIVGLNMGAWLGNFADFGFSYFLFKRAGYDGSLIFRWDFNKEEVFEVMRFGIRIVLGNAWVPAVATLQALMLTLYVSDYGSELAYYNLALQIGAVIGLVGMLCDSLQAPIAEAWTFKQEHGRSQYLARVYTSTFKWVNIINFFLTSSLLVIGWRLIIGFSGPAWGRASYYMILILIFQCLGPYSWIGDKFLLGCNKPTTLMFIWIIEQGTRAVGLLIFIPWLGMAGVMIAYIPALITKNLILIIIIRRKIVAPKVYWWQVWFVPIIAAVGNYLLLESLARAVWDGGVVTSILLFFIAVLGFINVFSFFTGLLGGWDENEMNEIKLAIEIAPKFLSLFLRMIYFSARLGQKTKSPLVGRSRIDLWEAAQAEMEELQALKKQLIL
jgi:O-antigen/teichoic acid export membrane protein